MATRWYCVGVLAVSTSPQFPRAEPAAEVRAARVISWSAAGAAVPSGVHVD